MFQLKYPRGIAKEYLSETWWFHNIYSEQTLLIGQEQFVLTNEKKIYKYVQLDHFSDYLALKPES